MVDSDHDGLSDALEKFLHSNPNDADSDDDGLLDGQEHNPSDDTDHDGAVNVLDTDSDNDGLFDGTEDGKGCGDAATDTSKHHCIADGDLGATKTSPLLWDTDKGGVSDGDGLFDGTEAGKDCTNAATHAAAGHCVADADDGATTTSPILADRDFGGVIDGQEDTNKNGRVDSGERDPNNPLDDMLGTPCNDGRGLRRSDERDRVRQRHVRERLSRHGRQRLSARTRVQLDRQHDRPMRDTVGWWDGRRGRQRHRWAGRIGGHGAVGDTGPECPRRWRLLVRNGGSVVQHPAVCGIGPRRRAVPREPSASGPTTPLQSPT